MIAGNALSANPLRIMRIGDSITWQMSGDATLEQLLDDAGVYYAFIGTQNWYDDGGYVPLVEAREPNQAVEGYPGMTTEWFTDTDFFWASFLARPTVITKGGNNTPIRHALTNNTPDIVLLMVGTNNMVRDINGVRGVESTGEIDTFGLMVAYSQLLFDIEELAPNAHLIVALLPTSNDTGGGVRTNQAERTLNFNENVVRPLVEQRIDDGAAYSLVDFFPLLDVPGDFWDDGSPSLDYVHPGVTGIPKLNTAWFEEIMKLMPGPSGVTFEQWIDSFPGVGELNGPSDEPAADGFPNLLKFALGLDPTLPARMPSPTLSGENGSTVLTYEFTRPVGRVGFQLNAKLSTDLETWEGHEGETEVVDLGNEMEELRIRAVIPSDSPSHCFLRIEVTPDP